MGPRLDPASQRLFPVALAPGYRERGAKHRRAPGWAGRGEAQGLTRSREVFLYLFLTSLRYLVYLSFFISNLISRSWTGVYPLRYTRQSSPSSICPPENILTKLADTSVSPPGPQPRPPKSTMLSTLSLFLPTTVQTNLSRLRSDPSSDPRAAIPSEPDYSSWPSPAPAPRPSSSSSATVSISHTPQPRPKRSFGALGESGASTPTEASCEGAALIRSLRESLVEGDRYGGSGIDWDSVRRGKFLPLLSHDTKQA